MTLTQLRYIIAIADTGSMNEAAKSLFISQPSLSLAVKELEKKSGQNCLREVTVEYPLHRREWNF